MRTNARAEQGDRGAWAGERGGSCSAALLRQRARQRNCPLQAAQQNRSLLLEAHSLQMVHACTQKAQRRLPSGSHLIHWQVQQAGGAGHERDAIAACGVQAGYRQQSVQFARCRERRPAAAQASTCCARWAFQLAVGPRQCGAGSQPTSACKAKWKPPGRAAGTRAPIVSSMTRTPASSSKKNPASTSAWAAWHSSGGTALSRRGNWLQRQQQHG